MQPAPIPSKADPKSIHLERMRVAERDAIRALREMCAEDVDRLRAEACCRQVITDPAPLSDEFKKHILGSLKNKRLFGIMELVAERLIAEGMDTPTVHRIYAQALIENGKPTAARAVIEKAIARPDCSENERADLHGLMGRSFKQDFVQAAKANDASRKTAALTSAIDWYMLRDPKSGWKQSPYHAINVVALRMRAQRDGIEAPQAEPLQSLAATLLAGVKQLIKPSEWDCAIAAEACIALGSDAEEVLKWIFQYTSRDDVDGFEVASTLRQFTEIWQQERGAYATAVEALTSALFDRQGSAALDTKQGTASSEELIPGAKGIRPVEWLDACKDRTKSVGLITTPTNWGTGFLVKGSDLCDAWGNSPVFLTNSHVTLNDAPAGMTVRFHGTTSKEEHAVEACLGSSPSDALDFAVLRLKTVPTDATCCPVAKIRPVENAAQRVFVIGYPDGGGLSISLYDNALVTVGDRTLHYTASTEPGSSGSPVFNEDWQAIGIHHGTGEGYFLDGIPYSAHEGIKLEAIWDHARLEPKPRPDP